MRVVRISNIAMDRIRARTTPGFVFEQKATPIPGGLGWYVPLSEETIERLEAIRLQGETLGDVIERLVSTKV